MKLKALSMKKKPEFSIPNLPNYRAFYNKFTELKNATKVSTELTPTVDQAHRAREMREGRGQRSVVAGRRAKEVERAKRARRIESVVILLPPDDCNRVRRPSVHPGAAYERASVSQTNPLTNVLPAANSARLS